MKNILKKYLMPVIASLLLIIVLTVFKHLAGVKFTLFELALWGSIITSSLIIRTIDDLFDYDKDVKEKKNVLSYKTQCIMYLLLGSSLVLFNVLIDPIFGAFISFSYVFFVAVAFKQTPFFKILIYPLLIFISFIMMYIIYKDAFNNLTSYMYILSTTLVTLFISILFTVIKRGVKKWANI